MPGVGASLVTNDPIIWLVVLGYMLPVELAEGSNKKSLILHLKVQNF